jgi:hypothetical protein
VSKWRLVEEFVDSIQITELVESPLQNRRRVSYAEAESEWLINLTVEGPDAFIFVALESRHSAIMTFAEEMHYIVTDIPESPTERGEEDAQVSNLLSFRNLSCLINNETIRWRLYRDSVPYESVVIGI